MYQLVTSRQNTRFKADSYKLSVFLSTLPAWSISKLNQLQYARARHYFRGQDRPISNK